MICCLVRDSSAAVPPGALEAIARACSPRVQFYGQAVVFDARGLARVLGSPPEIAREVSRLAAEQGLTIRVALAATTTAAWLLAHARPGMTVAPPEDTAKALADLPARWLATLPDHWVFGSRLLALGSRDAGPPERRAPSVDRRASRRPASARHYRMAPGPAAAAEYDIESRFRGRSRQETTPDVFDLLATFSRWGLHTLEDIARLPRAEVHTRLGLAGGRLHQAACGEDITVLVPAEEARRFVERIVLDWPVEGLEPLSFVLARLLEALSASLEHADRGAVEVTTRLQLVTRELYERVLHLPAPLREPRVLRTLILLDLESHPPTAGIDVVEVEVGVVPGRIVQGSLLERALPSPEDLSTLLARLGALMGDSHIGAPALLDTYDERRTSMKRFAPETGRTPATSGTGHLSLGTGDDAARKNECRVPSVECLTAFRRFRMPVVARVTVERGLPTHVTASAPGVATGSVVACAGPWRTSGHWWTLDRSGWDRDEWDVELPGGECYRLARDRASGRWEIEGAID